MSKLLTNDILSHCLTAEYPSVKLWENCWVGYEVKQCDPTVQHYDSVIIEWEVEGVPEPTGAALRAIVDKHKDSYQEPVKEPVGLTPELIGAVEAYLRQRDTPIE